MLPSAPYVSEAHFYIRSRNLDEIIHGNFKGDRDENGIGVVRVRIRIGGGNIAAAFTEDEGLDILLTLLPIDCHRNCNLLVLVLFRPQGSVHIRIETVT